MATGESQEASRREGRERDEHDEHDASRRERERDHTHGRRPHSSSRSRRDDPSPRRRREDRRHHESDRSHRHRSRAEEGAKAVDRDQQRDRSWQDAAQPDDPLRAETKPLDDARNGSPARHERSPRGTKLFPESRDARRPRSFFQHDERGSAGQGGRRYYRQASDRGRQRDEKEHVGDREKNKDEGKAVQDEQQNDGESTWKHDGFFQLEEEAHPAKRRPPFNEMGMPLEGKESVTAVTEPDSRSHKHDQAGPTSAIGEERRNYHPRGFDRHGGPFGRPDGRGMRRGFSDHRNAGQRNGYDSWGRFAGRGRGRDRFNNPYDGRNSMHQAAGDQAEKWKHDLYDQTNRSPTPKTEEEQIAKIEALLAL
uniref:Btz domain-containing protein n=1 Tax=Oryza meridionalis TaxID=40149 RepID=A0A0E0CWU0_9ORYZ